MHKKIIAAMGLAGFLMLSYVKVNYAMDYEAAQALAGVAAQNTEDETAEAKLIEKEMALLMASGETDLEEESEEFLPESESEEDEIEEIETAGQTKQEPVTQMAEVQTAATLDGIVLAGYNEAEMISGRVISVSEHEYEILLRIVEAEATGCDVLARMLVANVVINRMNSSSFPNTVEAVVFQKDGKWSQFSPLDDGRYYSVTITSDTIEAVNRVLAGEDYSEGALYFASTTVVDGKGCWASRHFRELFRYSGHVFFAP